MHGVLNINEKKLITQFYCKSRDESFKPSYSMIGQCLINKNESATMSFFQKKIGTKQGLNQVARVLPLIFYSSAIR